jgi:protein-S-isoprenylcysteine O-methyltransferase Ste14
MVNIADIPLGKPWTTGLYRYSRHPMVLSSFFVLIGTGIAAASWLFLLLSIVFIVLTNIYVADEEQFCLEKYGTSYHEYISRTPRWLGKPKSGKD